ncbi:hypothetical protein [Marinospirillum sp.]|uniref:hypothetical protein n=1 Tax=Marinospirillum sp. TaxID=2183934 RepID=UPI00384D26F9
MHQPTPVTNSVERLKMLKNALQCQLHEALKQKQNLLAPLARQMMTGIARPNDEPPGR